MEGEKETMACVAFVLLLSLCFCFSFLFFCFFISWRPEPEEESTIDRESSGRPRTMSSTPRPSPVLGEPLAKRHRPEAEDDQHTPSNPLNKTQGDFDLLILPDDHDEEKNPTIRYQKRFMVVRIHELKRTISSLEDKLRSLSASERHTQSLFLVIDQHWKIVCSPFPSLPLSTTPSSPF